MVSIKQFLYDDDDQDGETDGEGFVSSADWQSLDKMPQVVGALPLKKHIEASLKMVFDTMVLTDCAPIAEKARRLLTLGMQMDVIKHSVVIMSPEGIVANEDCQVDVTEIEALLEYVIGSDSLEGLPFKPAAVILFADGYEACRFMDIISSRVEDDMVGAQVLIIQRQGVT